jgi:NitT/TauT family transport system permease protein
MSAPHHVARHHRHMSISYPVSLHQRLYSFFLAPLIVLIGSVILFRFLGVPSAAGSSSLFSYPYLFGALGATFARLLVAYGLALLLSLPLAILVTHNALAEKIFLPVFDIMQSLPALAFFPIIIVFFIHWGFNDAAAVCILFLSMLWNIVFSLVGGLHVIPEDIKDAGRIFGLRGWRYVQKILLPASLPYLVTGSLLAFAQGWNIVIVAEVLHTYLPGSTTAADLFGIGSILVHTAAAGQNENFIRAILVLTTAIALLNFFVWQKLLHYAERFKFE